MLKRIYRTILFFVLTVGSSAFAKELVVDSIAIGLEHPWAMAFVDKDKILVTERPGRIRIVRMDGSVSAALDGLPRIESIRQGGLLDVILDRDFEENRRIYFCYTRPDPESLDQNSTAVAAATLKVDLSGIENVRTLFVQSPSFSGGFHFGCRLIDRGDGTLLLGLGDRYSLMSQAQDVGNHIGKVVRLNKDGSVPADNPFAQSDQVDPFVWSYGHRNIQGAVQDADGQLWMVEHGPQGGDELNLIEARVNYGWPVITYGENYGGGKIGDGLTEAPGMAQPVVYWVPSIAPSGLAVLETDRYGTDWRGSLLIGSLKFGFLQRVKVSEGVVLEQEVILPDLAKRVRDVRLAPDGFVYLLTDSSEGQLLRVKVAP
jgi:aldose sugar dehydrogenase